MDVRSRGFTPLKSCRGYTGGDIEMRRDEILAFIKENPLFQLATVDAGNPRVRSIMMYSIDDEGIVFSTDSTKDLHRQLLANPRVELCFVNSQGNSQVRISGEAELFEDQKLKEEIVEAYPFLKPWVERSGWEVMATYRVKKCVATFWTMEDAFAAKKFVKLF
jgi:uncharacterized pyridoxamine 5'-phosphate oxidase family protein